MKCLETFKNCKEVKHSMIMIIAIIYIFLSYVIFHKRLEITFRKSSTSSPLKKSSPTLFANIENFSAPPLPQTLLKGGGRTLAQPMLITVLFLIPLEGQQEPRNEVRSQSSTEHSSGVTIPLCHSSQTLSNKLYLYWYGCFEFYLRK